MKLCKIENEKNIERKKEREKLKIKTKFLEGHVPRNPILTFPHTVKFSVWCP